MPEPGFTTRWYQLYTLAPHPGYPASDLPSVASRPAASARADLKLGAGESGRRPSCAVARWIGWKARWLTGSRAGAYHTGTSSTVAASARGWDEEMQQADSESTVFKGRAIAPSGAYVGRMSASGVRRER